MVGLKGRKKERGSVVSWGELWGVACWCVGETKCPGAASLAAYLFPPNSSLQKDNKKDRGKKKERKRKTRHFQKF